MSKSSLTFILIFLSSTMSFAASSQGRVTMTVIRTDVQPADVNVVKSVEDKTVQQITSVNQSNSYTVEVIY